MRVAALQTSGTQQLGKIDPFESHKWELLDENRRPEYQLVFVRVEEECHEA